MRKHLLIFLTFFSTLALGYGSYYGFPKVWDFSAVTVAGQPVYSATNNILVVKTSDESRANTTAEIDDIQLTGIVLTPGTWKFDGLILYSAASPSTQGIRWRFTRAGTTPIQDVYSFYWRSSISTWLESQTIFNTVIDITTDGGSAATRAIKSRGYLQINSGTTTVGLTWAQAASNAVATKVEAGSYMHFTRVE